MKYVVIYFLCSVVNSQEIFELNRKIVDVFFTKINFLCLVHNNDLNNLGIIGSLSGRNVKTYMDIDKDREGRRTECGHSVIIAKDEEFLNTMLAKQHDNFLFLVHSTILVFFRGAVKIDIKKFQSLAIEKDLEIIIVKGLSLKPLFPPRKLKSQLMIYAPMKNVLLINCPALSLNCFDNFTYVRTEWTPLFMLKKLKKEFRVAFSIYPPLVIRKRDRLSGVDIEVAKLLTEGWPVHYKYLGMDPDRKRSYLHRFPVYYLNTTEADLAIGSSKFIGERSNTYPYSARCNTFLVHRGQLYPEATFTFQFFQAPLWLVLICIIVFMALLFKFSSGIYTKQYSLSHAVTLVLGYISSYGVPLFPTKRQTFIRFISLWWCFISLLIATYYSAGLTTSLRIPRVHSVISEWKEIVDNRIKWLETTSEGVNSMKESGQSLKGLAKLFQMEKSERDISRKLRKKKYAIRVEKFSKNILNIIGDLDEYGKENMQILYDCYSLSLLQYEMTYNSPVADFFNMKLLYIVEAGFVDYEFEDLSDEPERAYMEHLTMEKPALNQLFTLEKLYGCFLLLGVGTILGIVGLFYELYSHKMKEQKAKRKMRRRTRKRKLRKTKISPRNTRMIVRYS